MFNTAKILTKITKNLPKETKKLSQNKEMMAKVSTNDKNLDKSLTSNEQ